MRDPQNLPGPDGSLHHGSPPEGRRSVCCPAVRDGAAFSTAGRQGVHPAHRGGRSGTGHIACPAGNPHARPFVAQQTRSSPPVRRSTGSSGAQCRRADAPRSPRCRSRPHRCERRGVVNEGAPPGLLRVVVSGSSASATGRRGIASAAPVRIVDADVAPGLAALAPRQVSHTATVIPRTSVATPGDRYRERRAPVDVLRGCAPHVAIWSTFARLRAGHLLW